MAHHQYTFPHAMYKEYNDALYHPNDQTPGPPGQSGVCPSNKENYANHGAGRQVAAYSTQCPKYPAKTHTFQYTLYEGRNEAGMLGWIANEVGVRWVDMVIGWDQGFF